MSERIKGFTVVLDKDVHEDDFEVYVQAISLMKGVQRVIPYSADHKDVIMEIRTKNNMKAELYEIINKL